MIDINIDYAADDSCMLNLWARGTHDPALFREACAAALKAYDERDVNLTSAAVHNAHWRTVKADAETRAYGVCDTIRVDSAPGRGAYAVTVLTEWLDMHPGQKQSTPVVTAFGNRPA